MNNKQIVNVDKVKQVNTAAVYRMIDQQGPISRVKVAELSQLAPASVTKITRQLLATGLITEVAQQASTGGRRAISLMTEQSQFHFISAKLGRGDITLSLYDLSGAQLANESTVIAETEQEALLDKLQDLIAQFIDRQVNKKHNLIALGLTLSGLVNPGTGVVVYTPYYQLRNCTLGERLQQRFNMPCYIGNDTRAMALAEHYSGASQDCLDSVLISVHNGASAGIILDGQVFMSQHRDVGEIGHIQVDPLGERCQCGNIGCLETVVSNGAIVNQVKKLIEAGSPCQLELDQVTIAQVCLAALQGDQTCRQVLTKVGHTLGSGIAITINLFHPEKILIAGELMAAESIILPAIAQSVQHQALQSFAKELPIIAAAFQNHPTMGGLALVKRAMLDGSLLQHLINQSKD